MPIPTTLTAGQIAQMIDLSCVRTNSSKSDIIEMVETARNYGFGQVSVMQCFIPFTRRLIGSQGGPRLVGNVSFPSGSDTTSIKVAQAHELVRDGCDEIDMVMNVGRLRSGELAEVEDDVRAVIAACGGLPVKVIIESPLLTPVEIQQACRICSIAGAQFVKTGTGWAPHPTTVESVRLIRSLIPDEMKIKASGGIRDVPTLLAMYVAGARRFGVNLKSGVKMIEECLAAPQLLELQALS